MSEQMRKEFEDWATGPEIGLDVRREKLPPSPYEDYTTAWAWSGWQAALATQPQAPQGAVTGAGKLDEEDVDGHLKVALWEFLEKDAYQVVIPHGGILRGSRTGWITHIHVGNTFREAVQASIAAAPETPEGQK